MELQSVRTKYFKNKIRPLANAKKKKKRKKKRGTKIVKQRSKTEQKEYHACLWTPSLCSRVTILQYSEFIPDRRHHLNSVVPPLVVVQESNHTLTTSPLAPKLHRFFQRPRWHRYCSQQRMYWSFPKNFWGTPLQLCEPWRWLTVSSHWFPYRSPP